MCCCLHSYFLNDFFHCVIFLILFIYYNFLNYIFLFNNIKIFLNKHITGDWGLGIGDWGLGIGDWAQSPIPNPQSPVIH
jgi:hypothetical protein